MDEDWSAWPAPAKLNLFLHVVGRRADGYHLLQTVFQLLDWGDNIRLRVRSDGRIVRAAGPAAVAPQEDLTLRAATALRQHCRTASGVDICVEKRIPLGAGLGGGSSDAATVLVALNLLWKTHLDVDALAQIGLELGADVPAFVHGHSAWAEGVGEVLIPLPLPPRHYIIVDPGVHVPTATLFSAPELTRNSPPMTITDFISGTKTANAFAPIARARYPEVAQALDWLGRFGDARLSGSGGCAFVAMESAEAAEAVVRDCPPAFKAYRAAGVNRSPLLEALEIYRRRMRKD